MAGAGAVSGTASRKVAAQNPFVPSGSVTAFHEYSSLSTIVPAGIFPIFGLFTPGPERMFTESVDLNFIDT
jgi:hypothetical protein